jgi:AraC-like DNA-binding protein
VIPELRVFPAGEKVSAFVKCFWQLEKPGGYLHERLLPNGETQLIFHYGNPFSESYGGKQTGLQPHSLICGQFTTYKDIFSYGQAGLLGVVFHPYASNALFGIPAHHFTHLTVGLTEVERGLHDIGMRVASANTIQQRLMLIEDFILRRMRFVNQRHFAMIRKSVEMLSQFSSETGPGEVARSLFVGERQFERLFKEYVGITPGRFAGLSRFHKALGLFPTSQSLTSIALESGYYDQAHFIREFRNISGDKPSELRKRVIG